MRRKRRRQLGSRDDDVSCGQPDSGRARRHLHDELEESDSANRDAPEFVGGGLSWKLKVATTGGLDGGPVLVIDSMKAGNQEAPSLRVEGDRLLLDNETCYASGSYEAYDNEYRWARTSQWAALRGLDLHDLELQLGAFGRGDLDGLALLPTHDRLADWRLVRELPLSRVGLR